MIPKPTMAMVASSESLTVTMLPNRKLENVDELGTKPESTPASPMAVAMTMAMARSPRLSSRLRMPSTKQAAARQATVAPATGLMPAMSPPATPASEAWLRVSPIIERRLSTMITPTRGMAMPRMTPPMKARCMNAY